VKLLRDSSGAAAQPLIVMFVPFFALFLSAVQLGFIEAASLVTTHAATVAARSASVVLPDDPRFYDGAPVGAWTGARRRDVEDAAKIPLTIFDTKPNVDVSLRGATFSNDAGPVRVKVGFEFPCAVPLGQWILCGKKKTFRIEREAEMPYQGAGYVYP